MQLNEEGLKTGRMGGGGLLSAQYDREAMTARTKREPVLGAFWGGQYLRAFQANVVQNLLNEGVVDRGIIAVSGHEAMEKLNIPRDNYFILVTLKANGSTEKTVVGSVAESLTLDGGYEKEL